jgi:O-antigen/teichoic acid export membrane protein
VTSEPPKETEAARPKNEAGVQIARNSLWLMVDSFAGMFVSFFVSVLAARSLGPDHMGHLNVAMYFSSILRMVTEVAIPATIRKFAAELTGREEFSLVKTLVSRAMRLQAKLAVVGVTVGLVTVQFWFSKEQQLVGTLAVLAILPGMALSIPTGALWATGNLRHNVVSSLIGQATNLVGVTLVLVVFDWGLVGLVGSLLASRLVDCCVRFAIFRRQYARIPGAVTSGPLDPALIKRMKAFAAQQLVLALLYQLLFDRMEVFFIQKFAPPRQIAYFSISLTLVQYLLIIPQNLANSASVNTWVAQGRDPQEAIRTTATATWFIFLFAAPELFGVAALAEPLVAVIYGPLYVAAFPVLMLLSFFALIVAAAGPTQHLLVGAERQRFYILWMILAGALNIGGNVLLIPRYGAMGAAFAKGTSQVIAGGGFLVYLVLHFRAKLPIARAARLLVVCVVMFLAVRFVEKRTAPLVALFVGIPLGVTIHVVLLRAFRCLDDADADRLRRLKRMVPGRLRGGYLRVVDFVAPAGAVGPA